MTGCICGCGDRAVHAHHVIYVQHCRSVGASTDDQRNLVAVAYGCHASHHSRSRPYSLSILPDAAFEFAAEALGAGRALNYLRRRYAGDDPRLGVLL